MAVRETARPARLVAAVGLVAVAASAWLTTGDHSSDMGVALLQLPWPTIVVLLALAVVTIVHFASAAIALRDVSHRRLPLRQLTLVQLAAAATNRIVPNGVGGAGVNLRYLVRSGLAPGAATSALAMLAVVGGITDAVYVAGVTTVGPTVGLGGARGELARLAASGVAAGQRNYWVFLALLAAVAIGVTVKVRGRVVAAASRAARHAFAHLRAVAAHPRRLATAAAASMATTAVLSVGFVLAVRAWGHATSPAQLGALVAVYWVAAAAGGATPLPSFFGVTEAALVGGLVLNHYTSTSALVAVLVFRAVTYWLPLPMGVWAGRRLRRLQLL